MIKLSFKQTGSAHVVIIVILVIALLMMLGFVFWQNFINKDSSRSYTVTTKEDTNNEDKKDNSSKDDSATYTNNELSFDYPGSSWKQVDSLTADEIVRMVSDNYTPSTGIGLDGGSSLSIYRTNQQEVPNIPGVKDIREIKIDNNKAFRYAQAYEGYRLHAFFTVATASGEKNYAITMQTANEATADETKIFDLVLETLDIK